MKRLILPLFLFLTVFCYAQSGADGPAGSPTVAEKAEAAPLAQEAEEKEAVSVEGEAQKEAEFSDSAALNAGQILSEENNTPQGEEKSSAPLKSDLNKANPSSAEPSLEDFLKRQEELWLKEKAEEKSDVVVQENASHLQRPSILADNEPKAEEKAAPSNPAPANTAQKTVAKVKESPKQIKEEKAVPTTMKQAEIDALSPEEKNEEQPPKRPNDWVGFFKGIAFAAVLGAAVWLLSKYQ